MAECWDVLAKRLEPPVTTVWEVLVGELQHVFPSAGLPANGKALSLVMPSAVMLLRAGQMELQRGEAVTIN